MKCYMFKTYRFGLILYNKILRNLDLKMKTSKSNE